MATGIVRVGSFSIDDLGQTIRPIRRAFCQEGRGVPVGEKLCANIFRDPVREATGMRVRTSRIPKRVRYSLP